MSVFIPIPKKGSAKECSNYCTITLISHASKILLKILQAMLQRIAMSNLDSALKSKHHFADKGLCSHPYMTHPVIMYECELDHQERWTEKNWCFQTVVLEKTLESPVDSKEIKPVNPKGDQPWIFIASIDAEAKVPILWPPDVKRWLIGKDPVAWKNWGQEEKEATEDKIDGWHYWLNGYEFEEIQGDRDGQRSLACCSSWGCQESDMT